MQETRSGQKPTIPIFVDPISDYPAKAIALGARHCGKKWSHLWTEQGNEEALHQFAATIGLRRAWFQPRRDFPHYDLVPSKQLLAKRLGATETPLIEWLRQQKNCCK
jgi:hypothetical protein